MTSIAECACGCGYRITDADPSPDFKYYHCNQLWLASLDKPDPEVWRAEQRIMTMLICQHFTWGSSLWEFEWTDRHIGQYDTSGVGNVQAGLRYLYEAYDMNCQSWGVANGLPVLVRA